MNKKVENFITQFKAINPVEIEKMFVDGLCYWFADILERQFNGIKYYDWDEGHFICKIDDHFYDIRGNIDNLYLDNDCICTWEEYQEKESVDSERIIKYCKNLSL